MEVDISQSGVGPTLPTRKRKPESQENERLCKRVSLLNIEPHGPRLYIPVEAPTSPSSARTSANQNLVGTSTNPSLPIPLKRRSSSLPLIEEVADEGEGFTSQPQPQTLSSQLPGQVIRSAPGQTETYDEAMRLDDTPHKVYIYDLDAELAELSSSPSSGSCSDTESSEGGSTKSVRLALLPDLKRHLHNNRIPRSVLRADDTGKFAGKDASEMQLVLYGAPKSLSVPEDRDSVRRAIVEARERAKEEAGRVQDRIREAQRRVKEGRYDPISGDGNGWAYPRPEKDTLNGMGMNGIALDGGIGYVPPPFPAAAQAPAGAAATTGKPDFRTEFTPGFGPARGFGGSVGYEDDDAMDLDL